MTYFRASQYKLDTLEHHFCVIKLRSWAIFLELIYFHWIFSLNIQNQRLAVVFWGTLNFMIIHRLARSSFSWKKKQFAVETVSVVQYLLLSIFYELYSRSAHKHCSPYEVTALTFKNKSIHEKVRFIFAMPTETKRMFQFLSKRQQQERLVNIFWIR